MKLVHFLLIVGILCFASCNRSKDPDIQTLRSVAADKTQPDYIRESVRFFEGFLNDAPVTEEARSRAEAELTATRIESTLKSLIAILSSLKRRLPDQLPTEQHVMELDKKMGNRSDYEYRIGPAFVLGYVGNIIKILTYYDSRTADAEVNGFFAKFESKYGSSSARKYWLDHYRMEWKQALEARSGNQGKWKSGRKQMRLE